MPFPQAVPNIPVLDRENCTLFKGRRKGLAKDACGKCKEACLKGAIDYDRDDTFVTEEVGAIVVATGFQLYDIGREQPAGLKGYGEYGYGEVPDVIDGLQFERLASASGPTGGEMLRPSDGTEPKTVVFVNCVGSRDPEKGIAYCSKICCMYTAKHTMLYKHKVHDGRAVVFYMDIRAAGKGYDEFSRRAIEEDGAEYIRGRVSRIFRDGDKVKVWGYDTLSKPSGRSRRRHGRAGHGGAPPAGHRRARPEALGELRRGRLPERGAPQAAPGRDEHRRRLSGRRLPGARATSPSRWPWPAPRPPRCSACSAPTSSSATRRSPMVNERTCIGCFNCERVCPYGAIEHRDVCDVDGHVCGHVAYVNPGVCQGCGTCVAVCPSKSVELASFTDDQIYSEINALAGW